MLNSMTEFITKQNNTRNFQFNYNIQSNILFVFVFIISVFSPFFSFFLSVIVLYLFIIRNSLFFLVAFSLMAMHSASLITASREVGITESDDFIRYIDAYNSISELNFVDANLDVGIRIAYSVFHYFTGDIQVVGALYFHSLAICLTFGYFLLRLKQLFPIVINNQVLSIAILFFAYPLSTQLFRYFLSTMIVLIGMTFYRDFKKYILIALSGVFHIAVPLIYIFYSVLFRLNKASILVFFSVVFYLSINITQFAEMIVGSFIPGSDKFIYIMIQEGFDSPSISAIFTVSIILTMAIILLRPRFFYKKTP